MVKMMSQSNLICQGWIYIWLMLSLCIKRCSSDFLTQFNDIHKTIIGETYDPTVIPWDGENAVVVNASFKLDYIISLTEQDQILSSMMWNSFEWYDSRLTWDPSQLYGVESIRLPPEMVWTPDVMLQNSVGTSAYLGKLDPTSLVIISYTGKLTWLPNHRAETYCSIDAYLFPFDSQTCHFWYSSWAYPGTMLQLVPIITSLPEVTPNNTEWTITNEKSTLENIGGISMGGANRRAQHTVVIKRRVTFFNIVILTPCVILTVLTFLMFALPVSERMELGLAVWTSLVLFSPHGK